MPNLSGHIQITAGDTSVIDTVQQHTLGMRAMDIDGNEFIYLQGVASTVAGDWVVYDEDGITIRLLNTSSGPAAVAMAAIVASRYGWYQVFGHVATANVISGGGALDNALLYATATAGQLDDVDVSGDLVIGTISRSAESSGTLECQINYPFMFNAAVD